MEQVRWRLGDLRSDLRGQLHSGCVGGSARRPTHRSPNYCLSGPRAQRFRQERKETMNTERSHGKAKRTAEDRERHRRIREKYKQRPSQEELLATGDYEGPVPLGLFLEMRLAGAELRKSRIAAGLTLNQLAQRSQIDKAALSRLERG